MLGRTTLLVVLCVSLPQSPLLAQSAYQGHNLEYNLIFPVFVMGGPDYFGPRLLLSNPQPGMTIAGTLYVFSQDGKPLRLYRDPMDDSSLTDGLSVSIPAGGSRAVGVYPETGDLTVGWALFNVTSSTVDVRTRVAGSVVTQYTRGDGTTGLVGVVAAHYEPGKHKRISIPVWLANGVDVGVALVNAGIAPLTVTCELRDQGGTVVKSTANTTSRISQLAPGQEVALFVSEIFPDFQVGNQVFDGSLLISTDQEGLEAVGLLAFSGELTSIHTVHFAPLDSGAGKWDY